MARAKRKTTVEPELLAPLALYQSLKLRARRCAEASDPDVARLSMARSFCTVVIGAYWRTLCENQKIDWDVRTHGLALPGLSQDTSSIANELGVLVASFPVEDAGYLIGSIYTVMLPEAMRSDMGAYYTPPPLVNRLLDLAQQAGADFSTCTAIDPACGGGAFLAPIALRMLAHTTQDSAPKILADLVTRLHGIELDPFAAWMTQVLLEASVLGLCTAANERFPQVVTVGDALDQEQLGSFDLVIGNPPYGKVKLTEAMRVKYARSLYGHANLYGLFTDLALRLAKKGGVIAYLTPTSFLGGQYFKALRELITQEARPVAFDFISDRDGVFDNVLQETVLVAYDISTSNATAAVSQVVPQGIEQASIEAIGNVQVPRDGGPWLIPRTPKDAAYICALSKMPGRLAHLGYQVSTGQLVWNRHKAQLRQEKRGREKPIIWAESVTSEGFQFSSERRNHAPYIELNGQPHLITMTSCVLLQRTTAKEQERRLSCAVIPQKFIDQHGGVVVENHLNMIYAAGTGKVSAETIATILNSASVDNVFRCISGSVAVSAYELAALPLPSVEEAQLLEKLLQQGACAHEVENMITSFYRGAAQ